MKLEEIATRLQALRERVERAREQLDTECRLSIRVIYIQSENARNLANEALAEIRHLDEQLRELQSATRD